MNERNVIQFPIRTNVVETANQSVATRNTRKKFFRIEVSPYDHGKYDEYERVGWRYSQAPVMDLEDIAKAAIGLGDPVETKEIDVPSQICNGPENFIKNENEILILSPDKIINIFKGINPTQQPMKVIPGEVKTEAPVSLQDYRSPNSDYDAERTNSGFFQPPQEPQELKKAA